MNQLENYPKDSFRDIYLGGAMWVGSAGFRDLLVRDKEQQTGICLAGLSISLGKPRL